MHCADFQNDWSFEKYVMGKWIFTRFEFKISFTGILYTDGLTQQRHSSCDIETQPGNVERFLMGFYCHDYTKYVKTDGKFCSSASDPLLTGYQTTGLWVLFEGWLNWNCLYVYHKRSRGSNEGRDRTVPAVTWRHERDMVFALLALCVGNPAVTYRLPSQMTSNVKSWWDLCCWL